MIRINQLKLSIYDIGNDDRAQDSLLRFKAAKLLRCRAEDIRKLRIVKRSVDARDKDDIRYVYTLDVKLRDSVTGPSSGTEREYIAGLRMRNLSISETVPLRIPHNVSLIKRPAIIGSGPCGLFAAIVLAEAGLRPIIIERGNRVEERMEKTGRFFKTGRLDPESNIQFGEGGAGTFSDGKLGTGIRDRDGYIGYVLNAFVRFGADKSILYEQKPHIGTDVLVRCLKNIRMYIESLGGEYRFNTRLDGFACVDGELTELYCTETGSLNKIVLHTDSAVLATGHSARDTYEMLYNNKVEMEPKAFAVGVRVQHPQELIDRGLYGEQGLKDKQKILGPAAYKLTSRSSDGRGVYTFCMCPGGYVINSSSEDGCLCINGMSYSDRASGTANSAVIVTVTPEDFCPGSGKGPDTAVPGDLVPGNNYGSGAGSPSDAVPPAGGTIPAGAIHPLSGIFFQRELERKAYELADGAIPYETYGEFRTGCREPEGRTSFALKFMGKARAADLRGILPDYMAGAVTEGMEDFGRKIPGFNLDEAVIAGIESRTSSPVRIIRDKTLSAPGIRGLYPAGEGAGYAGGITSAAADGIRAALRIMEGRMALK